MSLTKQAKLVLILGFPALLMGGLYLAAEKGLISVPGVQSLIPKKAVLPQAQDAQQAPTQKVAVTLPGSSAANVSGPQIRFLLWAWNAQMGLMLANGGGQTTQGSLMEKHGVNLKLTRQDDVSQMQNDLIAFAKQLYDGNPQPSAGAHYVAIMGDGAASFLQAINPQLKKLGPDYVAEVIGSAGYSRGEDKFMGLPAWKVNPQNAKGALIAGYLKDGDWNIAMSWAALNGIRNNPDPTTYDPNALNWVAADSYIHASQLYVANQSIERPVVVDSKRNGQKRKVYINGVVTWTPGDVIVAQQRGGLVSILSTKENKFQMPNTIIGIRKWNSENRPLVEGMLTATFEGGQAVQASAQALRKAAEISDAVYAESNTGPDYWVKYFKGVTEKDAQGLSVDLGGSKVNTLADNLHLFGRLPGSTNLFKATYETFGDIVVQQYPKDVPVYPPVSEILNTSYVDGVAATVKQAGGSVGKVETQKFTNAPITNVTGKRSYNITFETGKATFTPGASKTLEQLLKQLAVSGGLEVEVHGYTDNIGNPDNNQTLSERRAFAVKKWFEAKARTSFPEERVQIFAHGETKPVASNDTENGRAKNRRVEIVVGTN